MPREPLDPDSLAIDTLCVHGAVTPDPLTGAINPPVYLSSTFVQRAPGEHTGYHYARATHPTRAVLEKSLALLESAKHCYSYASGCAATTAALLTLKSGDHVIVSDDVYSGTYRLLTQILHPFGLACSFVDLTQLVALEQAIRPDTRMIWTETPTNPLLKILDLAAISDIAAARHILVVVDNTFATPLLQRPLELGATLVMHSTTKYLNGHCDVLGGALMTNDDELAERLYLLQRGVGAVPSSFDCYLILRGLKTLPVRLRQQVENARVLVQWLVSRPDVTRVYYPGLPDHPGYDIAQRQMAAPGAIISFELAGGLGAVKSFSQALRLFSCAISLGGTDSLVDHPASMTHAATPEGARHSVGISDGLLRLSIGLEGVDDLRGDLQRGLDAVARQR